MSTVKQWLRTCTQKLGLLDYHSGSVTYQQGDLDELVNLQMPQCDKMNNDIHLIEVSEILNEMNRVKHLKQILVSNTLSLNIGHSNLKKND